MRKILIIFSLLSIGLSNETTLGGLVFFDYTYNLSNESDAFIEFKFNRSYFTFEKSMSDGISYKFQTDMGYKEDGKNYIFVKNALVKWGFGNGNLIVGLQGMNVFNVSEKTWGYRFLEKTPLDKNKLAGSADMGIGYAGHFNDLNYSVLITNGGGYKVAEDDKYKKVSVQVFHGEKKLVKNDGYNFGLSYTFEGYDVDSNTSDSKSLISVFSGFAGNGIRVGGEFDLFTDGGSDVDSQIISAYGNYKFSDDLEGYLRVDKFDPDIDDENDYETYLIVGLSYHPIKGLTIAPNLRLLKPELGDDLSLFAVNFEFKF